MRRLWKHPAVMLLHLALALIMVGGLLTWQFGTKSMLHLRVGESSGTELPFKVTLESFKMEMYQGTTYPKDYVSTVVCSDSDGGGEEIYDISMNHIYRRDGYRLYQMSYDEDLEGTLLAVVHDPWGIGVTYVGYAMVMFSMIWMLFARNGVFRRQLRRCNNGVSLALGIGASVAFSIVMVVYFCFVARSGEPMMPVLRSPFFYAHVSVIMIAYALFAVMALLALCSLVTGMLSKGNRERAERLTGVNRLLLYPAVLMQALGIIIGSLWANVSWGAYWSWDPKETWALITLLVYAAPFHRLVLVKLKSWRAYNIYIMCAILSVLVTYYGVNFLMGGLHSYGS